MATTPTPASAAPAAAPPTRPTRTATPGGQVPTQNPGWLRTNQSLRGETLPRNDRVVDPLLWMWVKRIAFAGGAALLLWIAYGSFVAGDHFGLNGTRVKVIERIIERPAPAPTPAVVQPPPRQELTPEERAEQYKEERRRQYGVW